MVHGLVGALGAVAVGLPLMWLSRRGLFGSKAAYAHAQSELREHHRVVLSPPIIQRMVGTGPIILDCSGLTVNRWGKKDFYAWCDVTKPFELQLGTRNSHIFFSHKRRNPNFGRKGFFRNTKSEHIEDRQTIGCAYAMGWDNLLSLLNEGRSRPLDAGVVLSPVITPTLPVPERIAPRRHTGRGRSSPMVP